AFLRGCGCSCGPEFRVYGRIWIRMKERGAIRIGRSVTLISRFGANLVGLTSPVVLDCRRGGHIEIGDCSGCSGAVISSHSSVKIGRHVKIGGNVRIYDHDFHSLDFQVRREAEDQLQIQTRPVEIGDDVFIGANAIILKGVSIGARAVVGAGSVVSRNIGPDEIWAGNPARLIRASAGTQSK
ncbi:MAG TPA: acyltransferase, partial [Kiritimatiellia bacterium]|nr:acyltransferase [Kiritimatiellia bacterium]